MQRHVDPQEAQEVVRLAAERRAATPNDGPTVEGLAEALGLPTSEVERLLAEVRGRRIAPPTAATTPQRNFGDRSSALSAGLALILVLVVALVGGGYWMIRHNAPTPVVAGPTITIGGEDGVALAAHAPAAPPVPTTVPDVSFEATTPAMDSEQAAKIVEESLRQAQESFKNASGARRAEILSEIDRLKAEIERLNAEIKREELNR